MSEPKSPFQNYTVAEVMLAESCSYVIQVGSDLFSNDGKLVFSKKSAIMYYNKILNSLMDVIDGGDEEERADAMKCLRSLHIHPLRIN